MKGILTNCVNGAITEIKLDYKIAASVYDDKNKVSFDLINGVTGYESFYLTDETIKKAIKGGWYACAGTKSRYDTLFIPAEEMEKALTESGYIVGD